MRLLSVPMDAHLTGDASCRRPEVQSRRERTAQERQAASQGRCSGLTKVCSGCGAIHVFERKADFGMVARHH